MKVKLLRQIRKRFDIKSVGKGHYLMYDKNKDEYTWTSDFCDLFFRIAHKLGRFWEMSGFWDKREHKLRQLKLKKDWDSRN